MKSPYPIKLSTKPAEIMNTAQTRSVSWIFQTDFSIEIRLKKGEKWHIIILKKCIIRDSVEFYIEKREIKEG